MTKNNNRAMVIIDEIFRKMGMIEGPKKSLEAAGLAIDVEP